MDAKAHNKDNTEKEFLAAYDEYSDAIYRHCYFRVYSKELAEELVQETFMKVWDYARGGNNIENIRAFLYKVATNLIIDHSRKNKRNREMSLDYLQDVGFDPGKDNRDTMVAKIEGRQLLEVVKSLDEKYRDAVVMRYIDDLTPQEIAEITGESPNVISVRLHRGVKQVREILEDQKNER